jgi:tRNA/tmRNA/rRNA uracil-C5-methylase (TrmA/RlmC/RlmD family)
VPRPGDVLTLDIEKPAAGGRMLARHDGQVALVAGAIPGERVAARIEQVRGGVLFAGSNTSTRLRPTGAAAKWIRAAAGVSTRTSPTNANSR